MISANEISLADPTVFDAASGVAPELTSSPNETLPIARVTPEIANDFNPAIIEKFFKR